jgi:cell division protein FtsI (penicillin-binding protein 3)
MRPASRWQPIDLANHGFGQGIAVTPIQLASAYAAIANGGVLMSPFIVKRVVDSEGNVVIEHTPHVVGRALSPQVAHQMNVLLRRTVEGSDGTGHLARVADLEVAGKTGTAQMADPRTHGYFQSRLVSSFVGFVPADDPRLVILVVLEDVGHGGFGGLLAAPVFSTVATGSLGHLNFVSKKTEIQTAGIIPGFGAAEPAESGGVSTDVIPVSAPDAPPGTAPDFTGLSLRRALKRAHESGVNIIVEGSGYVISQTPSPGAALEGATTTLILSADGVASVPPGPLSRLEPLRGKRIRR